MNKQSEKFSPQQIDAFVNSMNIIFYLAVCIPLLFFILIFLELQERGGISPSFEKVDEFWHLVIAGITVLLSLPGYFIYKQKMKGVVVGAPLSEKLNAFKEAAIIKYLFLFSGGCLANLFLYYFSEQIFLMAFAVLLVMFSIDRPTVYRMKKDIPLSNEEKLALTEYRKYL